MSKQKTLARLATGALVVALASGAGVTSQAAPTSAAVPPTATIASTVSAPRYIVEFIDFYCGDESGADWFGSDEPYWVTTSKQLSGHVRTMRSEEFGDVDSGDRRKFSTKSHRNLVWPRQGQTSGGYGPVAFSTQLYEADGGSAAAVVDKTLTALDLVNKAGALVGVDTWIPKVPTVVRNQLVSAFADDTMGSRTIKYSKAYLAHFAPAVGSHFDRKYHFSGNSADLFGVSIAGAPDYDLHLRVTRVA